MYVRMYVCMYVCMYVYRRTLHADFTTSETRDSAETVIHTYMYV